MATLLPVSSSRFSLSFSVSAHDDDDVNDDDVNDDDVNDDDASSSSIYSQLTSSQ